MGVVEQMSGRKSTEYVSKESRDHEQKVCTQEGY